MHRYIARVLSILVLCVFASFAATADDAGLYFPPTEGDWATVSPESVGWDVSKLDAALEYAEASKSSGVVILLDGRILAERYWDIREPTARYQRMVVDTTSNGRAVEDVASVQKGAISFLIAQARERNGLKLSDRVSNYLEVGWSDTHRDREHAITVREVMSMTTGLKPDLSFQFDPGTYWRYNTNAYSKIIPLLETATGKDIATLTREWITEPIGMTETRWAVRKWVTPGMDANRIGFATSARDLARFGLLILAEGTWDGNALLENTETLRESLESSQRLNPAYGLLWWLNGKDQVVGSNGKKIPGTLIPTAPDDLVAAQGALGRKCYIVPSQGLVVTRLGQDPGPDFNSEFWARLMAAVPKK